MLSRTSTVATLVIIAAFLGAVASVEAVPTLRFDQAIDGGMLSYAVVGGVLTGTDIRFDNVTVSDTGATDGLYPCSSCRLNFTSGPNVAPGPVVYAWGAGGSFTITGGIPGMGIPVIDPVTMMPSVLLSGTFGTVPNIAIAAGGSATFTGFGTDAKHETILTFLGLPDEDFRFVSTNIGASTITINADGTFSGDVTEADVTNTVPEPTTSLLMLLGLAGIALRRRYH